MSFLLNNSFIRIVQGKEDNPFLETLEREGGEGLLGLINTLLPLATLILSDLWPEFK